MACKTKWCSATFRNVDTTARAAHALPSLQQPMLTAIIDVRLEPVALSATLGPLVRGVVEGLVGTAVLVTRSDDQDVAAIADAAGCRVIVAGSWSEGFARAITNAPGAGILVLDTGIQLGPEFWPLLSDKLQIIGNRPAATEPATRAGLASPIRIARNLFNAATGRISRDCVLLLPPGRAREIAQAKADPFTVHYGKSLVRLKASATRVELG